MARPVRTSKNRHITKHHHSVQEVRTVSFTASLALRFTSFAVGSPVEGCVSLLRFSLLKSIRVSSPALQLPQKSLDRGGKDELHGAVVGSACNLMRMAKLALCEARQGFLQRAATIVRFRRLVSRLVYIRNHVSQRQFCLQYRNRTSQRRES